ncbi:MAG: MinD/ParA family protein [Gammaproteobacteria bacterium]|nr:MinD/ParA family protein [Gammaproteobacteria bacterium]MDH5802640.1 MinD/ParA family protein [Gammaproteobacteria bacterium]
MLVRNLIDQATGLRRMSYHNPVRVIAITSGKGGVGKTNVSVNLGIGLARMGREVMLMDADLGLANVDVMLGLHGKYNLSHVIKGEKSLDQIAIRGPENLRIIPAASGLQAMAELGPLQHGTLIRAFSEMTSSPDVLLIDTAAGISDSVVSYAKASQEVVVVICDEPTSITDAYALIKLLNRDYGIHRFRILANMVESIQNGRELYQKFVAVTDRFLDVSLDFMGMVPHDEMLKKAVQRQRAVSDAYPRSKSSLAFKKLAQKADAWPLSGNAGGRIEFFVEKLILASRRETGVAI